LLRVEVAELLEFLEIAPARLNVNPPHPDRSGIRKQVVIASATIPPGLEAERGECWVEILNFLES
jgi:hypothetical protein